MVNMMMRVGVLAAVAGFAGLAGVRGQAIYTSGHGDLGVEYDEVAGVFVPHWHMGAGAVVNGVAQEEDEEYEPDGLVARAETKGAVSGGVATALGVGSGTMVFRLGTTAYAPNLGFGLEELAVSDWATLDGSEEAAIRITLTGVSGPGELAISQTVAGVGTFVWFSSKELDGGSYTVNGNEWVFAVGGHQHLDWWFSVAGDYEVSFTWEGLYVGEGAAEGGTPVSGAGTFGVQAVPEPGTWVLLIVGGVCAGVVAWRRARGVCAGGQVQG